jgi:hypothetical protein
VERDFGLAAPLRSAANPKRLTLNVGVDIMNRNCVESISIFILSWMCGCTHTEDGDTRSSFDPLLLGSWVCESTDDQHLSKIEWRFEKDGTFVATGWWKEDRSELVPEVLTGRFVISNGFLHTKCEGEEWRRDAFLFSNGVVRIQPEGEETPLFFERETEPQHHPAPYPEPRTVQER